VLTSSCLIAKGVNMESESGNAANDIKGDVKEHVFGGFQGTCIWEVVKNV